MSQEECAWCGATEDVENGTAVGRRDPESDPLCNQCLADHLEEYTMLSERESEVMAFRQITNLRTDLIADVLGIEENTVQEYQRRAREKAQLAEQTTEELVELL